MKFNINCIVSLTTHSIRTKNVLRTLRPIIEHIPTVKVVLNIFANDYSNITTEIFDYIFSGKIELFVSPIDLGSHLKYFFSIKRYSDFPIIIIDDDIIYPDNFVDELLTMHSNYPECIISRRPEKISFQPNGDFVHYHFWKRPYYLDEPSHELFPTGVGGILFPPNCFDLNADNMREILTKCKSDDDVYIKILALRKNIKIKSVQPKQMYKQILDDKETQSIALCNTNWNRTLNTLISFKPEIEKLKILLKNKI